MPESIHIKIYFVTEKIVGHGEDAPPLLVYKETGCAVGVFDGMGGSGAAICKSVYGDNRTKAYVSSRIAKDAVCDYLNTHLSVDDISEKDIKETILNRLKKQQESYPPEIKSTLRSKLVRDYPTTMALVTLLDKGEFWQINSYWAGDSHCYLWTKDGFFQISRDDLEEDNDPMENLHNDSPISNCICTDRDFTIHHNHIELSKEPVIILCATDGCFGYFPTPMHFEHMLKNCLRKSRDEKDWQERINQCIQKVTGDDTSLSLIGVGFSSFEQFKNKMTSQSVSSLKRIKYLEDEISKLKKRIEQTSTEYDKAINSGWESYKHKYMKYLYNKDNATNA